MVDGDQTPDRVGDQTVTPEQIIERLEALARGLVDKTPLEHGDIAAFVQAYKQSNEKFPWEWDPRFDDAQVSLSWDLDNLTYVWDDYCAVKSGSGGPKNLPLDFFEQEFPMGTTDFRSWITGAFDLYHGSTAYLRIASRSASDVASPVPQASPDPVDDWPVPED